jgi:hypothetical protein
MPAAGDDGKSVRPAPAPRGPQQPAANPLKESQSMKTLRPNPAAQRGLRLFGKYRVLFNVDEEREEVTIILVGEKRGSTLLVRGQEFTAHHESHPAQ